MDIYTTPAMEAPEGEISNLINPTSLMTTRIGLCSAALAVVLVLVSIRVYIRCVINRFNFEDCQLDLISLCASLHVADLTSGVLLFATVRSLNDGSQRILYMS